MKLFSVLSILLGVFAVSANACDPAGIIISNGGTCIACSDSSTCTSATCADGYSGDGATHCNTAASCGALTVANSDHSGSTSGTTTDAVAVTCDDGYSGSGTSTCTATGPGASAWSTVTCVASTCAQPSLSANEAYDSCSAGGALGATCSLTCAAGYTASSVVQGSCLADSGASTASYQNQAVTCNETYTCSTGSGSSCASCVSVASRTKDDECASCNDGHALVNGVCVAATCAAASTDASTVVNTCISNGALGDSCNLACAAGYYPSVAAQPGTCTGQSDGTAIWTGQSITCSAVTDGTYACSDDGAASGNPLGINNTCRPATSLCDVAEICDGVSLHCPSNGFEPDTAIARAAASVCDLEEFCSGVDAIIPDDIFAQATDTLAAQRKLRATGDRRLQTLCDGLGNILSGNSASPASAVAAFGKSTIATLVVTLSLILRR